MWWSVKEAKLQPKSRQRYEDVLRVHLRPEFGNAPIGSITHEWVRDFLASKARETKTVKDEAGNESIEAKYAPGTLHKIHTTLSSIMQEAVKRGIIGTNPCRGVAADVVSKERRKMEFLEPAEAHALADAITPHHRPAVLTAAFTGLRAGELWALRRRDIDLTPGRERITVQRALKMWRDCKPEFGSTKTEQIRTVELAPEVAELLRDHLSHTPSSPDALVFTNEAGGPVHHTAWTRNHFRPAVRKALPHKPGLRVHDLRHTFVSLLIHQGVNAKAVAAQAGHASAAMTLDRYGHLYPADDARIRKALSAAYHEPEREVNVVPLRQAG